VCKINLKNQYNSLRFTPVTSGGILSGSNINEYELFGCSSNGDCHIFSRCQFRKHSDISSLLVYFRCIFSGMLFL